MLSRTQRAVFAALPPLFFGFSYFMTRDEPGLYRLLLQSGAHGRDAWHIAVFVACLPFGFALRLDRADGIWILWRTLLAVLFVWPWFYVLLGPIRDPGLFYYAGRLWWLALLGVFCGAVATVVYRSFTSYWTARRFTIPTGRWERN